MTAEFRHEAFLYAGDDEFMDGALTFIRGGLEAGEPMLVAVSEAKIAGLRGELGADADCVVFADMESLGANPARIIPAWSEFVDIHPWSALRGIGEPIWPGRGAAELSECHRHESLLNLAFARTRDFWLLCPYDTARLEPEVVERARTTHPTAIVDGAARTSATYSGPAAVAEPFSEPLEPPPTGAPEAAVRRGNLRGLRLVLGGRARAAGLSEDRVGDLVLAANELFTNSIVHGGGRGTLQVWRTPDALVCEVRDAGRIDDPLVGRERPDTAESGGYGLWLANQLCDLVQVRSFRSGTVVRLHMRLS